MACFLSGADVVSEQEDEAEARSAGLLFSAGDAAYVPASSSSLPPGHAPPSAKLFRSGHVLLYTSRAADGLRGAIVVSTHDA